MVYGSHSEQPAAPEAEGWTFLGWYKEAACETVFDFTAVVEQNTTVYAKWANASDFAQTGEREYTIHTETGWGVFCDLIDGGETFTGKTVKLCNSISVSRMAGDSDHKFAGTFNGGENTLTLSFGTSGNPITGTEDGYFAPFCYTDNATIKNLNVGGTIYTAAKHCGGIIGLASGTTAMTDCHSSVSIISSINGDGTHGGLIACTWTSSTTNITGCVFDGSIQSASGYATDQCGGFVGWRNSTINVKNSLMAADLSTINPETGDYPSATFVRHGAADAQYYENSYYTDALGTAQGTQIYPITPGDGVTLSAATSYANGVVNHGGTLYAKEGASVGLTLGYSEPQMGYSFTGYAVSAGTLTGDDDTGYTLTMPAGNVTVTAKFLAPVVYYDENGTAQSCADYTVLTASSTAWEDGKWYVASGDLTIASRVTVTGEAHLILCDDANLTVSKGIQVAEDNCLTIYAQNTDYNAACIGTMLIGGYPSSAGIGGNEDQAGGNVTINGGWILIEEIQGGAGIGGGSHGDGGTVIINGGHILVNGGDGGAGIGNGYSGCDGGTVAINGGWVEARGGNNAAGISGSLTVNFSSDDDGLLASSYGGTVTVQEGKVITDGTGRYYAGTLTDTEKAAIAYKSLVRAATVHIVSVNVVGNGGTVTASPTLAEANTPITLSVELNAGCALASLIVTDADGNPVAVTNNQFNMPSSNVTVTAAIAEEAATAPKITGYNLALNGMLNLNYFIQLPADFDCTGAQMNFSVGGRTVTLACPEPVYNTLTFSCPVYAYEMGNTITATFTYGEGQTVEKTYSVERYLKKIVEDNTGAFSAKDKNMAAATLNYGKFMLNYLNELHSWQNVHTAVDWDGDVNVENAQAAIGNYGAVTSTRDQNTVSGVQFFLNANDDTKLNFVVTLQPDVTGTVSAGDGLEFESLGNGQYLITKTGIGASNLNTAYNFVLNVDDTPVFTASASVMTYAKALLTKSTGTANELKAMAALYEYYIAASAY